MADITAAQIRKVREITGAGMTDVKNALVEAGGDEAKAIEELRTKGIAKSIKRGAERTTSNGLVAAAEGALIELACETDFVAKNEQFQTLAANIVARAAVQKQGDVEQLLDVELSDGKSIRDEIAELSGVIGEKLELRRAAYLEGKTPAYMHRRASDLPPQIGVLVQFEGDDTEVARQAAMQVSAFKATQYVTRDEVPEDVIDNERRIAEATAREEGKPEQAMPKIIEGRVNGFFKEVVLLEQPFVREQKKTVKQVLDEAGVTVKKFARFEVGSA
jgi:elongation factor Ts